MFDEINWGIEAWTKWGLSIAVLCVLALIFMKR